MEEGSNAESDEEFRMSDCESISDDSDSVSDVADEELNLS